MEYHHNNYYMNLKSELIIRKQNIECWSMVLWPLEKL